MTWHLSGRNLPLERKERSNYRRGNRKENKDRDGRKWTESKKVREVELVCNNKGVLLCLPWARGVWEEAKKREDVKEGEVQAVRTWCICWLTKYLKTDSSHSTNTLEYNVIFLCPCLAYDILIHSCSLIPLACNSLSLLILLLKPLKEHLENPQLFQLP